ncbi:MAG TPA: glycosyltransferase family 2 protein [Nitrospiraceae bacterium]|nr:glycosyltransferase family 2 protein [Nitrospiraceae bacterium]
MSASSRPWASIVIPIKDERDNLPPLTEQLLKVLGTHERSRTVPFEILYIDDGSTDGSSQLMDNLAAQYPQVRVLHFDRNYGQTSAFDAGFRQAKGDLIVTLDGDLQFDPADILTLLPLAAQYDLVCGWRKDRHDNLVRKLSSRIAYAFRSAVLGDRIHDTGCSLKVFRRGVVEQLQLFEGLHRFFPALAKMHGFTLTEVPVRHLPRAHGTSKYGIGNRLFKSLYDLIAVRWMQRRVLRYALRAGQERQHP